MLSFRPPVLLLLLLLLPLATAGDGGGGDGGCASSRVMVAASTWCVARSSMDNTSLQAALDYACGVAGADCSPISSDGLCFLPNTLQAHASYAMNSYYQRSGHAPSSCDFSGTGVIIAMTDPSYGSCVYPLSVSMAGGTSPTTPSTTIPTPTTTPVTTPSTMPWTMPTTTPTTMPTPTTGTPTIMPITTPTPTTGTPTTMPITTPTPTTGTPTTMPTPTTGTPTIMPITTPTPTTGTPTTMPITTPTPTTGTSTLPTYNPANPSPITSVGGGLSPPGLGSPTPSNAMITTSSTGRPVAVVALFVLAAALVLPFGLTFQENDDVEDDEMKNCKRM